MFKQTLLCLIVFYILSMIYILFIHKSWEKQYAEQYYDLLKESQIPSYFTNYIKNDVEFPNYMVEHFSDNDITSNYKNGSSIAISFQHNGDTLYMGNDLSSKTSKEYFDVEAADDGSIYLKFGDKYLVSDNYNQGIIKLGSGNKANANFKIYENNGDKYIQNQNTGMGIWYWLIYGKDISDSNDKYFYTLHMTGDTSESPTKTSFNIEIKDESNQSATTSKLVRDVKVKVNGKQNINNESNQSTTTSKLVRDVKVTINGTKKNIKNESNQSTTTSKLVRDVKVYDTKKNIKNESNQSTTTSKLVRNVKVTINGSVTKTNIKNALNTILPKLTDSDIIINDSTSLTTFLKSSVEAFLQSTEALTFIIKNVPYNIKLNAIKTNLENASEINKVLNIDDVDQAGNASLAICPFNINNYEKSQGSNQLFYDCSKTPGCEYEHCEARVENCDSDLCNWIDMKCSFIPNQTDNKTDCTHKCLDSPGCNEALCDLMCKDKHIDLPSPQQSVPSPPEISALPGDGLVTLTWNRPYEGANPIRKYIIMGFKTNDHSDGVRVEVGLAHDIHYDSPYFNYQLRNLINDSYYTIGIIAVNDVGESNLSNIIDVKPYSSSVVDRETKLNNLLSAEVKHFREEEQDLVNDIIKGLISNGPSLADRIRQRDTSVVNYAKAASCLKSNALKNAFRSAGNINLEIQ